MNINKFFYMMTIMMVTIISVSSCGNKNISTSDTESDAEVEEPAQELLETSFSFVQSFEVSGYTSLADRLVKQFAPDRYGLKNIIITDDETGKSDTIVGSPYADRTFEWDHTLHYNYRIKMNYEDGSASAIRFNKLAFEDSKGNFYINTDTTYYDGSWKSRSVKRGNKYVEAYEFQLSNVTTKEDRNSTFEWVLTSQISIYTTEKLDRAYLGLGKENDLKAFNDFDDGVTGASFEIFDIENTWK